MMNKQMQNNEDRPGQPRVLIVDDEYVVTESLRQFFELETDYHVLTFQSPFAALEALKERPADLVISDYLMPEMNGLEFLIELKRMYPEVVRILLTGYADKENAIRAINEVGLFQYIEKPWDNNELYLIIRNGLAQKSLKATLNDKIQELDKVLLQRDALAQSQEAFKEELALARQLQESIFPHKFPETNGISFTAKYHPALDIGGDFYDVIPLSNHRLAVLIADITGHGIQAALSTTLLKFCFSDFRDRDVNPDEILIGMNEALYKILPVEIFVAALIVTIDTQTGHCSVVNGGVPYPFLIRRNKQQVERIFANGLVLGVVGKELFNADEEICFNLETGDCLLLYTDGLCEIENEAEEHFDDKVLRQMVSHNLKESGNILIENIIVSAQKFSKKDHEWDDFTVLAIEMA